MSDDLNFTELLDWAAAHTQDEFLRLVPEPVLVATGTMAIKILPGSGPKVTGQFEVPSGETLRERLRNDPQLARVWQVGRKDDADGPISVGRTHESDVTIEDQSLSRHHAELRVDGDTLWVKDLGSKNGTFVDERPIGVNEETPIFSESIVRFARVSLQYYTPQGLYEALRRSLGK